VSLRARLTGEHGHARRDGRPAGRDDGPSQPGGHRGTAVMGLCPQRAGGGRAGRAVRAGGLAPPERRGASGGSKATPEVQGWPECPAGGAAR
jgi:hypothetical protein